jgi:hypothetical protein
MSVKENLTGGTIYESSDKCPAGTALLDSQAR